jgi:hypothetical protein
MLKTYTMIQNYINYYDLNSNLTINIVNITNEMKRYKKHNIYTFLANSFNSFKYLKIYFKIFLSQKKSDSRIIS